MPHESNLVSLGLRRSEATSNLNMEATAIRPILPKPPAPKAAARNAALDFTKGFLVLLMVVYHWFNYFVGPQANIYKYLRFLTPSFIFISGFIVAHIYFTKYDLRDIRLPVRLATRGLKLIALFLVLNALLGALLPVFGSNWELSQMLAKRFTGTAPGIKDAAFPVLVAIGELLLLSAALVFAYRFSRYVVHVMCAFALAVVVYLRMKAIVNTNADLIAISLLGMVLGTVPLTRLISVINRPVILTLAFVFFNIAVHNWGERYPLQVIGVCLNIAIIYLIGASRLSDNWLGNVIVLLGKYSLFGYIAQIAILQILRRTVMIESLAYRFAVSFTMAILLTTWSVQLLDALRKRSSVIDGSYKVVFA
jgi:peptidoglycan/LPS O-acetylase OafA/YrhL